MDPGGRSCNTSLLKKVQVEEDVPAKERLRSKGQGDNKTRRVRMGGNNSQGC